MLQKGTHATWTQHSVAELKTAKMQDKCAGLVGADLVDDTTVEEREQITVSILDRLQAL